MWHAVVAPVSYTTFNVSLGPSSDVLRHDLVLGQLAYLEESAAPPHELSPLILVNVTVTNTGDMASDFVIMLFATSPNAGVDGVPLQSLVAFERVHVGVGESVTVTMPITAVSLAHADADGALTSHAGAWTFTVDDAAAVVHVQ
jgi:hypothetical protein